MLGSRNKTREDLKKLFFLKGRDGGRQQEFASPVPANVRTSEGSGQVQEPEIQRTSGILYGLLCYILEETQNWE